MLLFHFHQINAMFHDRSVGEVFPSSEKKNIDPVRDWLLIYILLPGFVADAFYGKPGRTNGTAKCSASGPAATFLDSGSIKISLPPAGRRTGLMYSYAPATSAAAAAAATNVEVRRPKNTSHSARDRPACFPRIPRCDAHALHPLHVWHVVVDVALHRDDSLSSAR